MISDKMARLLNDQITAEFAASHKYLALACVLDEMGLKMLSARFVKQAAEERDHAMRILNYLLEVGAKVTLAEIAKPAGRPRTAEACVQAALDGEVEITERIHRLMGLAINDKDYATQSFLKWFVDEQVEEVASMRDLLQLVRLAGTNLITVENRLKMESA